MAYNIEDRKEVINDYILKLDLFKNEIQLGTLIENQLSSLYVKLSNINDTFIYGDVSILNVRDEDAGDSDRRKKATQINIINDDITINSDDTNYNYDGYIYSVPMTFPDNNYPYYVKADGTVVYIIADNSTLNSIYENYIIDDDVLTLDSDSSEIIMNGLKIVLDDMYYYTHEKNTDGDNIVTSNEVILSIKGILNYIDSAINNMNYELTRLNTPIVVEDVEQLVADIFNLKNAFDGQDTRYAGMIGNLYIGFGLYVENQTLPSCATSNIRVANVVNLDKAYVHWRDVVNVETLSCSVIVGSGDDSSTVTYSYQVYRLDYEKVMKLPSRVLIPLVGLFVTSSMNEVSHCEFDELILFIITVVIMIHTGAKVNTVLGGVWASAYVILSIVSMSGQGSDDFKMAVNIAILAITMGTAWESMAVNGSGLMEVLGFSVQLASGTFDLYSKYDLAKDQKDVDRLASEVNALEEELDLADMQDKISEYIYDMQYTDMYDKVYDDMYDSESPFYMGGFAS